MLLLSATKENLSSILPPSRSSTPPLNIREFELAGQVGRVEGAVPVGEERGFVADDDASGPVPILAAREATRPPAGTGPSGMFATIGLSS